MENDVLILWNAIAIFEMSKNSWQMGKTPYKRRFGEPFTGPVIPFGAMVEYHPISTRDHCRGSTNLARKFHLEYSLDMH